jgi:hypothetical protein
MCRCPGRCAAAAYRMEGLWQAGVSADSALLQRACVHVNHDCQLGLLLFTGGGAALQSAGCARNPFAREVCVGWLVCAERRVRCAGWLLQRVAQAGARWQSHAWYQQTWLGC